MSLDYFTQIWTSPDVKPVIKSRNVGLVASRDFSKEEILHLKACYTACHCRHFAIAMCAPIAAVVTAAVGIMVGIELDW